MHAGTDDRNDAATPDGADALQLVVFSVGEQAYGVEITAVREIRAWGGATPLPNSRDFVRGVVNLRGTIVPILDLRARFGGGRTEAGKTHVVVVLSTAGKSCGLLVDAVSDIIPVGRDALHPVPPGGSGGAELLSALATHEGTMIGLIDLPAVVAGSALAA